MTYTKAYPDSFRLGAILTMVTGCWWLLGGGLLAIVGMVMVMLATLFVFPWLFVQMHN